MLWRILRGLLGRSHIRSASLLLERRLLHPGLRLLAAVAWRWRHTVHGILVRRRVPTVHRRLLMGRRGTTIAAVRSVLALIAWWTAHEGGRIAVVVHRGRRRHATILVVLAVLLWASRSSWISTTCSIVVWLLRASLIELSLSRSRRLALLSAFSWLTLLSCVAESDLARHQEASRLRIDALLGGLLATELDEAEAFRVLCHGVHDDLGVVAAREFFLEKGKQHLIVNIWI